jgi:hypothetical protein
MIKEMDYVIYMENDFAVDDKSKGMLLYKYLRNQIKSDKKIRQKVYIAKREKWRNFYALVSKKGAPEISKRTFIIRVFIRKKSLIVAFRGKIEDFGLKRIWFDSVTLKPQFKTVLKLKTKENCDVVFRSVREIVMSMGTIRKKGN